MIKQFTDIQQFKAGDRVKVHGAHRGGQAFFIGTVVRSHPDTDSLYVQPDDSTQVPCYHYPTPESLKRMTLMGQWLDGAHRWELISTDHNTSPTFCECLSLDLFNYGCRCQPERSKDVLD